MARATSRTTGVSQVTNQGQSSYRFKSENETLNKKVSSRRQKVERDAEDTMSKAYVFILHISYVVLTKDLQRSFNSIERSADY